ncbi:type II secretion system F family protein [Nitrosopumilus sp.]|uniref:type II secretion system F family protein n=1 Tax=Nitrosopumilus sp. TaxID=2024843 RepID=UPI00261FFCF4|nr:type II secretion system F family protein [Nitrosopumilus sp.]
MTYLVQESLIKKILSTITFENRWNMMLLDINNDVISSGKPVHTVKLLNQIRTAMLVLAVVVLPVSIILMQVISVYAIALNLIWITLIAFPKIQQTQLSQERKQKVERELPAFVMFTSVMQGVGINLYESFQLFKDTKLFKALGNESEILKRNVDFFGLSQMEALEDLGRTHKSELFSSLVLGYTSIWRSGGDLTNYLEIRADEFFIKVKEKYLGYANTVGSVVELLVTLMIILPILIMVTTFVVPGNSIEQIALVSTIGLPMFAIIIGIIINAIQPPSFNTIGLEPKVLGGLIGIGIVAGGILHYFEQELWIAIAAGFIIPSTISAVIVGRQSREIKYQESELPQFLRDVTEFKKIGYDVRIALSQLHKERQYHSRFSSKLMEFTIMMENGISPTKSVSQILFRPWIAKISFFLLAYVSEYGGGSPKILETITRFITTARQSIREGTQSVSMLSLLIYASPVIMVFTATVLQSMLAGVDTASINVGASGVGVGQSGNSLNENFTTLVTITPEFLSMIKVMVVTSSIMSAFVIGKAIDFTFYNSWRPVVVGLISVGSILIMDNYLVLDFDFEGITERIPGGLI